MSACRQPDDASADPIRCSNEDCDGADDPFNTTFTLIGANQTLKTGVFDGIGAYPDIGSNNIGLNLQLFTVR